MGRRTVRLRRRAHGAPASGEDRPAPPRRRPTSSLAAGGRAAALHGGRATPAGASARTGGSPVDPLAARRPPHQTGGPRGDRGASGGDGRRHGGVAGASVGPGAGHLPDARQEAAHPDPGHPGAPPAGGIPRHARHHRRPDQRLRHARRGPQGPGVEDRDRRHSRPPTGRTSRPGRLAWRLAHTQTHCWPNSSRRPGWAEWWGPRGHRPAGTSTPRRF